MNLPFLQVPLRWLGWLAVEPLMFCAGTRQIGSEVRDLSNRVGAMSDVMHIVVAHVSGDWTVDQRERVQRMMASFPDGESGLAQLRPTGNPLTNTDIRHLQDYTARLQQGDSLTVIEAQEFRKLADIVAREHSDQDWVKDLLKLALFAFAVYAVAEALKGDREGFFNPDL